MNDGIDHVVGPVEALELRRLRRPLRPLHSFIQKVAPRKVAGAAVVGERDHGRIF